MERSLRRNRIAEIEKELEYKESQFWEDSPYHDMKISALRRELAELEQEDWDDYPFSLKSIEGFLTSIAKRWK